MASSTAVPAATCEEVTGEPSMENPTKEYLYNLTKLQLQKRCRNIGLTNVWANKDQLVDKIMAHHRDGAPSSCNTPSSSEDSSVNSPSSEQVSSVSLNSEGDSVHPCSEPISAVSQCSERNSATSHNNNSTASNDSEESIVNHNRLECEIRKLYELFEIKNCEIKHTYEEIKKMNTCFHHLNACLARLEETVGGRRHSDSDPAITQNNEFRNTASLITNLSNRISDMEKKCTPLHGRINKENLRKHIQSHNTRRLSNKQIQRTPGHSSTPSVHQQMDSDGWRRVGRRRGGPGHTYRPAPRYNNPPHHSPPHGNHGWRGSDLTAPGEGRSTLPHYLTKTFTSHHDNSQPHLSHGWTTGQPHPHHHPHTHGSTPPPPPQSRPHRKGACYNCGETNHTQNNCRFDHKVIRGDNYNQNYPPLPPPTQLPTTRGRCYNCGETNHIRKNCRWDHKVRCSNLGSQSKV
ncbi:hypothetical protein Pcinc_014963 [Petrolisthes cinctipes]|uniref:CCHC-type domain-containing protein n=1 Tax=Petrolisthes cinctipes TaxID=88211 RepID=A0AAE1KRA3_PETCI|nr:hypothetical protein Pcinc_014963 [Petrolisthes cinctipes]